MEQSGALPQADFRQRVSVQRTTGRANLVTAPITEGVNERPEDQTFDNQERTGIRHQSLPRGCAQPICWGNRVEASTKLAPKPTMEATR